MAKKEKRFIKVYSESGGFSSPTTYILVDKETGEITDKSATPKFYKGASVTPVYEPLFLQINKLRQKVEAGAMYVQTQGLFDLGMYFKNTYPGLPIFISENGIAKKKWGNLEEERKDQCRIDYLREQVKAIDPKIIVCLGRISAMRLIKPDFKITQEHGQWFKKGNYLMTAVYHPAAVLRDPRKKEDMLEDMKKIKEKISE